MSDCADPSWFSLSIGAILGDAHFARGESNLNTVDNREYRLSEGGGPVLGMKM